MLITRSEFESYIEQGYNRIPVVRQVLADYDTPLSVYLKLANAPYSYLLESVQGGEKWGRYSIIGLPANQRIEVCGYEVKHITAAGEKVTTVADPLEWVQSFLDSVKSPEINALPRLSGGLVGYFGYDTVRYIEPRLAKTQLPDPLALPDISLMVSDELVVFDNLSGQLFFIVQTDVSKNASWDSAQARLDELVGMLAKPLDQTAFSESDYGQVTEADFQSQFTQSGYEAAVDKIKQYILDGDAMQVVPSQRMTVDYPAPPLNLYRALRCTNPSPYMFFLNMDDFHIVGSSPEILARFEHNEVTVRPIAGTRKRGATEEEDLALEADLLADPKEIAEHLMLIDLGRNDVGRIAEIGSVKLTDKMMIERYSHVMHIVSNVTGEAKAGMNAIDVLRATFPAGTLSGAPKIRAMEIIDELEPVKRGIYGGAVGYIAWDGNMDTAIAIRTAVIKDQKLYIQAGAGVVADSDPTKEWEETLNKGRAVFNAARWAMQGLKV